MTYNLQQRKITRVTKAQGGSESKGRGKEFRNDRRMESRKEGGRERRRKEGRKEGR